MSNEKKQSSHQEKNNSQRVARTASGKHNQLQTLLPLFQAGCTTSTIASISRFSEKAIREFKLLGLESELITASVTGMIIPVNELPVSVLTALGKPEEGFVKFGKDTHESGKWTLLTEAQLISESGYQRADTIEHETGVVRTQYALAQVRDGHGFDQAVPEPTAEGLHFDESRVLTE